MPFVAPAFGVEALTELAVIPAVFSPLPTVLAPLPTILTAIFPTILTAVVTVLPAILTAVVAILPPVFPSLPAVVTPILWNVRTRIATIFPAIAPVLPSILAALAPIVAAILPIIATFPRLDDVRLRRSRHVRSVGPLWPVGARRPGSFLASRLARLIAPFADLLAPASVPLLAVLCQDRERRRGGDDDRRQRHCDHKRSFHSRIMPPHAPVRRLAASVVRTC